MQLVRWKGEIMWDSPTDVVLYQDRTKEELIELCQIKDATIYLLREIVITLKNSSPRLALVAMMTGSAVTVVASWLFH